MTRAEGYGSYAVLHKLLDKYESSTAFVRGERTTRRIQLALTDAVVPKYKSGGMDADVRRELHMVLQQWADEGIVELDWDRFEVGNMLARVILCWDGIEPAYRLLGRRPKTDELVTVREELSELSGVPERTGLSLLPWMKGWLADILAYLEMNKSIPGHLIPLQQDKRSLLLKTLAGLVDKGDEVLPMRLFSKRYLKSSKAFETQVRSRLVSLLRQYWDFTSILKDACDAANMVETETFLLSEIGIEVSHEDIAFCGPIVFQVESEPNLGGNSKSQIGDDISSQLDCSAFPFGLALDAEVLDRLWILELPVKRIVSIENRTNYRHYIRHERKQDELVIYLGGFPSPGKRRFLYKLAEFSQLHLDDTDHDHAKAPVFHHWGDLDYGGILICQTLRDSVWPKVQPWRMEPLWIDDLMQFVEPFDEEYRARLEGLLLNPRYCLWKPLIQKLLEVGGTLEQEAFLV